jgi:hypothetical protein
MADPKKSRPLLTYEKHRVDYSLIDYRTDYCPRLGVLFL